MRNALCTAINDLLALNGMKDEFYASNDFYLKVLRGSYTPLTVERHGDKVNITHFTSTGGEFPEYVRDPEVVFSLDVATKLCFGQFGLWTPVSIEPGGLGRVYRTYKIETNPDHTPRFLYSKSMMKEAIEFGNWWARNLRAQNFIKKHAPDNLLRRP